MGSNFAIWQLFFKVGTKLHLLAIATAIELFRMTFVTDPFAFAYANTWIYAVGTGVAVIHVILTKHQNQNQTLRNYSNANETEYVFNEATKQHRNIERNTLWLR